MPKTEKVMCFMILRFLLIVRVVPPLELCRFLMLSYLYLLLTLGAIPCVGKLDQVRFKESISNLIPISFIKEMSLFSILFYIE
jgi:hypothetical protein